MTNCGRIDNFESFQSIFQAIELTETNIKKLRYYLISQLNKCNITDVDDYTFKELIDAVGDIDAPEVDNSNNTKPLNEPSVTEDNNILDYLKNLYQRIRYYMRLLAHYLVLKSVPTYKVAEEDTLMGLISLIDLIPVRIPSTFIIQPITEEYYFGSKIELDYTLKDIHGNDITEGEITIESDGIVYDSITAGETISFIPIRTSEYVNGEYEPITFTITYHGTAQYSECEPINKEIIVLPSKIVFDLFVSDMNAQSFYYGNTEYGYENDVWNIVVKTYNFKGAVLTNVPFSLSISDIEASIPSDYIPDEETLTLLKNQPITGVTDDTGTCVIECLIGQVGKQLITVETTYENSNALTNTEKEHAVTVYFNPLYQTQKEYIDYQGRLQYEFELIIRNIYTGTHYDTTYDGYAVNVFIDERPLAPVMISDGRAMIKISSLPTGTSTLLWDLRGNQRKTKITIFSNFILPNKDLFYLSDTPDIYYAPLYSATYGTEEWSPKRNKKVVATITYYDDDSNDIHVIGENISLYTNNEGILHAIKEYTDLHTYTVTLSSKSDNLKENNVSYTYKIAKPFSITLNKETYNKTQKIEYDIKIYDMEHFAHGDYSCISFDKNIKSLCTITDTLEDGYYNVHLIVPARTETYGNRTLTVTVNGYSESNDFILVEKSFDVLTSSVELGNDEIRLKCYDDSIQDITIESDDIVVNSITKQGDIFIIDATFYKSGDIPFIINAENDIEPHTIHVNKRTITPDIIIEKVTPHGTTHTEIDANGHEIEVPSDLIEEVIECYYRERGNIQISLLISDPLYHNITVTYSLIKDGTTYYTENCTFPTNDEKVFTIPSSMKPGNYTIKFIYTTNNASSYNSFTATKSFTILKEPPTHAIVDKYSVYASTQSSASMNYNGSQRIQTSNSNLLLYFDSRSGFIFQKSNYTTTYIAVETTGIPTGARLYLVDENSNKLYSPYDTNGRKVTTECYITVGETDIIPLPARFNNALSSYTNFNAGAYNWKLKFYGDDCYLPNEIPLTITIRDFNIWSVQTPEIYPNENILVKVRTPVDTIPQSVDPDLLTPNATYDPATGIITYPNSDITNKTIGLHTQVLNQAKNYSLTYTIKNPIHFVVKIGRTYDSTTTEFNYAQSKQMYVGAQVYDDCIMTAVTLNNVKINNVNYNNLSNTDIIKTNSIVRDILDLPPDTYVCECKMTLSDGIVYTCIQTIIISTKNCSINLDYIQNGDVFTLVATYLYNMSIPITNASIGLISTDNASLYTNISDSNGIAQWTNKPADIYQAVAISNNHTYIVRSNIVDLKTTYVIITDVSINTDGNLLINEINTLDLNYNVNIDIRVNSRGNLELVTLPLVDLTRNTNIVKNVSFNNTRPQILSANIMAFSTLGNDDNIVDYIIIDDGKLYVSTMSASYINDIGVVTDVAINSNSEMDITKEQYVDIDSFDDVMSDIDYTNEDGDIIAKTIKIKKQKISTTPYNDFYTLDNI